MKTIALALAFAVLVPLAVTACHCCPVPEPAVAMQIEKAPCHGCCTEGYELTRDCGTLQNKIVSSRHSENTIDSPLTDRPAARLFAGSATPSELLVSPSFRSPLSLSSVLRI